MKDRTEPKIRLRIPFLARAVAALLAGLFACSASAENREKCDAVVRLGVPDFDRMPSERRGNNMTSVELEIVRRIGQQAGIEVMGRAHPYARVLSEFRSGNLDGMLIAEGVGRTAIRRGTRVPMMRLIFVRVRANGSTPTVMAKDTGLIRGMAPAGGGVESSESVTTVNSYVALLKMLKSGKVQQIIAARPSIDAYLTDDPSLRDRLAPMEPMGIEPLSLHLRPSLSDQCRTALADAARIVARRDLPGILRQGLPGLDVNPFLLDADVSAQQRSSR